MQRHKLSRKLLENLESEIQILKKLNHPHIVALNDCRKTDKYIHIIMEYCSVGDLSVVIKKRDRMASLHPSLETLVRDYPPPPGGGLHEVVARHFLKQLASALEYLRKDGLVHRDVKPQNLLLNPPPEYEAQMGIEDTSTSSVALVGLPSLPTLKLADFGFARVLPTTSMAETLCGSPLYMAPEILRYEKYDATADLWSVGTVIYEMVTGKPPFRAPNHVDLLRRIEAQDDNIEFPPRCTASSEIRQLMKALLKRNPTARMNFDEFFSHPVITNEIPGAAVPPVERSTGPSSNGAARSQSEEKPPRLPLLKRSLGDRVPVVEPKHVEEPISSSPQTRQAVESSALPFATNVEVPVEPPRLADLRRATTAQIASAPTSPRQPTRPTMTAQATAPGRQELAMDTRRPAAAPMERVRSGETASSSPSASLLREQRHYEREREREREALVKARAVQRRAANGRELRESEEYVIVDKQQVQVNAFADELATARRGRITPPSTSSSNVVRKVSSGANRQVATTSRRPPEYSQVSPSSFERRYGTSPSSAKSALAKALEVANLRLFGVSISPPNQSPPNMQSPFPAYPNHGSMIMVPKGKLEEEDMRAIHTIEEAASRSDVVYNLAEVKFLQLMPTKPKGLGLLESGTSQTDEDSAASSCLEMTPDAVVQTAEEAMVLFVKALSLLSKAMDVAGRWWAATTNNRTEPTSTARQLACTRMNNVVQWVRERFNEVLDKAETVRDKQLEAMGQLPPTHPSHPNNQSQGSDSAASGNSWNNFAITTGVSAEKLMYDRALEMSRASAVNELIGDDLPGCEIAYVTSVRLLEAVMDMETGNDGEELKMDEEDKEMVEKCEYHF